MALLAWLKKHTSLPKTSLQNQITKHQLPKTPVTNNTRYQKHQCVRHCRPCISPTRLDIYTVSLIVEQQLLVADLLSNDVDVTGTPRLSSCFNPVCSWRGERLLHCIWWGSRTLVWLPVIGRLLFGRHLYTFRKQAIIIGHLCHCCLVPWTNRFYTRMLTSWH